MSLPVDRPALDHAHRQADVFPDDLADVRWSGGAAAQLQTAWAQWRRGVADLLSGLRWEGDALALTRAELTDTDEPGPRTGKSGT